MNKTALQKNCIKGNFRKGFLTFWGLPKQRNELNDHVKRELVVEYPEFSRNTVMFNVAARINQ